MLLLNSCGCSTVKLLLLPKVTSKLRQQSYIFVNPFTIISEKDSVLQVHVLQEENIKHVTITTELSRANGYVK